MNMDNEHNTEKDQLLLQKKYLEERIAKHQGNIEGSLEDPGIKREDFVKRLEPVLAIVEQSREDLRIVLLRLSQLP